LETRMAASYHRSWRALAFAVEGDGVGFATESYAASALCTTLASLSGTLWRIRRARRVITVAAWCAPNRRSTTPAAAATVTTTDTGNIWTAVQHIGNDFANDVAVTSDLVEPAVKFHGLRNDV